MNPATLTEWIKCAFNGNVLELAPQSSQKFKDRVQLTMYIDNLCNNRTEVMRKIHKINYSNIFSPNFQVQQIDNQLTDLEIDE